MECPDHSHQQKIIRFNSAEPAVDDVELGKAGMAQGAHVQRMLCEWIVEDMESVKEMFAVTVSGE